MTALDQHDCPWVIPRFSSHFARALFILTLGAGEQCYSQLTNFCQSHASSDREGSAAGPASARGVRSGAGPLLLTEPLPTFDCFISYRRAGGADFAQLLKVCRRIGGVVLGCRLTDVETNDVR